ncbi:hypothetical protein FACS1894181_14700 [Bacteroidia bacterium]|nr:hypothetical protein FACS1894181_14700 [Bacteroidia bacterium]
MKTFKICSFVFSLLSLTVTGYAQNTALLNKGHLFVKDTLYISGSIQAEDSSKIVQKGHTIVTGDLVNNVTTGHVFTEAKADNTGSFEFKGDAAQTIKGAASKSANYINFPTKLIINNQAALGTVTLKADKSATAQDIDVKGGRLVIDSEPVASAMETNNAHLLVEGTVTTGIQVNLAMGDNYQSGRVAGFTSPFVKLYADYFFFNFLTRPSNVGLFGDSKRLITNPRTRLEPGVGYLIGLGIIPDGDPYYNAERDPRWNDADPTKRAKDMFRFSRIIAEKTFDKYLDNTVTPGYITDERLNTGNVTVNLKAGFNYLGNPYTAPLDLNDIVEQKTSSSWGAPDGKLKNGFYVLTNGAGTTSDKQTYTFTASYLKKQTIGSTAPDPNVVAPMQMFIVWAENDMQLTIPASKRKHETVSYLRSTANEPIDELLIETTDMETGGFDRFCVVFRENASPTAGDFYDAPKFFNLSGGVNQIYTRSSDDKKLSISVVPTSTGELPMYFEPASKAQMVTLKANRLESLVSVSNVVLVDTKTGAKVNLLQTPEYTFASSPSDKPDRFVLRFSTTTTGVEDITPSNVYASYNGGFIQVHGLQESDLGSALALYSMNGQQLYSGQVREVSPCRIQKDLLKGVYLLKTNKSSLKLIVP